MTNNPFATRGYLNRNPGNIRISPEPWLGKVPADQNTDGTFEQFVAAEWGIRALVKNATYWWRHGKANVGSLIAVWAPPNENNTAGYVDRVCTKLGVGPADPIDMTDYKTAYAIADAIICVECYANPYPAKTMEDGLRLAGLVKPVTLTSSTTVRGAASASIGAALQPVADQIQTVAYTLEPAAGQSQTLAWIVLALKILGGIALVAGIGFVLYERFGRAKRDEKIEATPPADTAPAPIPVGAA